MNDIKIKVKKSELEYCFKADNYDEFHRRFNQLADILYQRFIIARGAKNEIHK